MRKKVTIVGAGNVGATAAHWMASKELANVVLIDVLEGVPQGKGLDLLEAMPIEKRDSYVLGTNDYADTANSDIVVITAGIPRKPGMSRDDLLNTNYKIMQDVVAKVVALLAQLHPDHRLQSAGCHVPRRPSSSASFPANRVIGMAGRAGFGAFPHLHRAGTERLRGERDGLRAGRTRRHHGPAGAVLHGGRNSDHRTHGPEDRLERLVQRTRDGGAEIVKYLKTGSAYYAPSAAAAEMVEAILKDKKKILPCAAYLEGEYGINGLFVGVPCKLGANGLEQIIEIKLTAEEQAALQKSADSVAELVKVIGV